MTEHYLDRLAKTINENWDQPALTDFYLTDDGLAQDTSRGNHYTYGEMYLEIFHICDIFRSIALQKGDHIAICGANSAHWAIAYLAIAAYQGVAVTILHSQAPEDIARQINFSDAKVLFTDNDLWDELQSQSLPQIEHVISLENWQILRGREIQIKNQLSTITNRKAHFDYGEPDDLAMICFTSGSTGNSKGVMLTYRAINNGINSGADTLPICEKSNYVSVLPFAHIFGLFGDMFDQLLYAHHLYVMRTIIPNAIYTALEKVRPYAIMIVPAILNKVLHLMEEKVERLSEYGLRQINMGGAGVSSELEQQLSKGNIHHVLMYGMTEGLMVSGSRFEKYRKNSSGLVSKGVNVKISIDGEILVKGENVMLGYYKDPEATARKIDSDGWLHTGDKGHLDGDGYLYVEGRLDQDMIVLPNGENIHPEDIERKINFLPEVSESIVFARDGKLVAIVVPEIKNQKSRITNSDLRRMVLRTINPQLPLYSQLYDVEITDTPLAKTEKQTLKRYLYK